jgi:hypothetical protein
MRCALMASALVVAAACSSSSGPHITVGTFDCDGTTCDGHTQFCSAEYNGVLGPDGGAALFSSCTTLPPGCDASNPSRVRASESTGGVPQRLLVLRDERRRRDEDLRLAVRRERAHPASSALRFAHEVRRRTRGGDACGVRGRCVRYDERPGGERRKPSHARRGDVRFRHRTRVSLVLQRRCIRPVRERRVGLPAAGERVRVPGAGARV